MRAATNPFISQHRRMNVTAQQTEFLSWKVVPARLDATQTAWFLGFEPHQIPWLVSAGLLKPLGHPARNSTKFFATETLEQFRRDEKWLARASDAIASYWRERNAHKTATEFFTTKLGFAVDFIYGDPPFYGQVSRDNVKLALRYMDESFFAEDIRQREGLLSASITVASADEIKRLFLAYQSAGTPFAQSLRTEPWQAKTFIVKDPDGNLILFAGPAN
ncbi:MAG TPA: VOC family protein [Opitutales bacterium]|nr:VOC family protein [Opitutales bacterium]